MEHGITINIQGTPEDPRFQASQIGALLGLVNIRETIKDFDEDETSVSSTDTSRTAVFLTELGLYRQLGASRKPCARPFQKWVAGSLVATMRGKGFEKRLARVNGGLPANCFKGLEIDAS